MRDSARSTCCVKQAAFLDLGVVAHLAKLLSRMVDSLAVAGSESTALCTMVLEIITVLFNHDVCLNSLMPAPQRVLDECPTIPEVFTAWLCSAQAEHFK